MPPTSQLNPERYFTERGWALLDQCEVTDGPVPYWIKLATLRNNSMIAMFVGSEAAPSIPTNIDIGNDHLPDMLPTDVMLEGLGYNATFQQYYDARFNPNRGQVDELLCVMFGGRLYSAMRSSPPSNNPVYNNQNSISIFPKDRVVVADVCRAGGVPCAPALDMQAGIASNWFNAPVGPPTLLNAPVNYGNGKLAKLPITANFSPCCANDLNIDMVDPAGGVVFIQTSGGGTALQQYYISPVKVYVPYSLPSLSFDFWFNFDATILAPLCDAQGYYTWSVRITTVDCGIYVAELKAPIIAPSGGYVELVSFNKL